MNRKNMGRFCMEYSFNVYNTLAPSGEVLALKRILPEITAAPVIVCIGSDLSVGDSLGPVTGTKLKEKLKGLNVYVYGTLSKPITAHEVKYTNQFIKNTHPDSTVIAIDAAVGVAGDIGLIKVAKRGLNPGSGANKRLAKVGDVSVMGIVAEKSLFNYSLFSSTRLNIVYKMAEIIAEGVATYIIDAMQNLKLAQEANNALLAAQN
ncbi:MAG: spore protease YyaC [Clostridia bacterium]|nr:spore protease YyaC [Clostridia bacterium]